MMGRNRISGKTSSDALKSGNNAGMLFLKEAKRIEPTFQQDRKQATREYTEALWKLRIAEKSSNGDVLRGFGNPNK
jgi:hypothetical protein